MTPVLSEDAALFLFFFRNSAKLTRAIKVTGTFGANYSYISILKADLSLFLSAGHL